MSHDDHDTLDAGHDTPEHAAADSELPPDEPHSPTWLPLLGVALFSVVLLALAFSAAQDSGANGAAGSAAHP